MALVDTSTLLPGWPKGKGQREKPRITYSAINELITILECYYVAADAADRMESSALLSSYTTSCVAATDAIRAEVLGEGITNKGLAYIRYEAIRAYVESISKIDVESMSLQEHFSWIQRVKVEQRADNRALRATGTRSFLRDLDTIEVPNDKAAYILSKAVADSFGDDSDNEFPYQMKEQMGVTLKAQLIPANVDELSKKDRLYIAMRMWELEGIRNKEINTSLFHIFNSIILTRQRNRNHEPIIIERDDILDALGFKKKRCKGYTTGYRREDLLAAVRAIKTLQYIWCYIEDDRTVSEGQLYSIRIFRDKQFIYDEATGDLKASVDYSDFCRIALMPAVAIDEYLFPYVDKRQLKVLQYPERYYIEKRIWNYLKFRWRASAASGLRLHFKVSTLLSEARYEVDTKNPARSRQRIEDALDKLVADLAMGKWYYVDWNEDVAGKPGWVNIWLNTTIIAEPTADEIRWYASFQQSSIEKAGKEKARVRARKSRQQKRLAEPAKESFNFEKLGEQLRAARKARDLSQTAVAQEIGITQSMVSRLERGQRGARLKEDTKTRLAKWLKCHTEMA